METFAARLLMEVELMDGLAFTPHGKVDGDEKVILILEDAHARKLYSSFMSMRRECEHAQVDMRHHAGPEDLKQARMRVDQLLQKTEVLKTVFWATVCDLHGLWDHNLGIRSGWRIVEIHGILDRFRCQA